MDVNQTHSSYFWAATCSCNNAIGIVYLTRSNDQSQSDVAIAQEHGLQMQAAGRTHLLMPDGGHCPVLHVTSLPATSVLQLYSFVQHHGGGATAILTLKI